SLFPHEDVDSRNGAIPHLDLHRLTWHLRIDLNLDHFPQVYGSRCSESCRRERKASAAPTEDRDWDRHSIRLGPFHVVSGTPAIIGEDFVGLGDLLELPLFLLVPRVSVRMKAKRELAIGGSDF